MWFKIGAVALSVMGALTATGGEALAWGPVTHQKIVAETRDEMEEGGIRRLWVAYPRYVYGGVIAPDWCVAYATAESGAGDAHEVAAHQDDFHSLEFLKAIETLADTDWERAFYYSYESHVVSGAHEESFGAVTSHLGDHALEFYVDKMLVSDGYCGEVDIVTCAGLMVAAYKMAFPNSAWQPTVSQITALYGANWAYQLFWLPYVAEINIQKGYRYYSDYASFIDASIQEVSLMPAEK